MKIKVNGDACISCGACEAICPSVFKLNDDRISECKEHDLNNIQDEEVKNAAVEAMQSCPTGAIIEDQDEDK